MTNSPCVHREKEDIRCVGIIMDGNRRYAKKNGLLSAEGHQKGYENFLRIVTTLRHTSIEHAVFYAFSTENWKRSEEEVESILSLAEMASKKLLHDEKKEFADCRVRFIGQRERFSDSLQDSMRNTEVRTKDNAPRTLWIALSYGGRAEILRAVRKARETDQDLTEEDFGTLLETGDMPDPDLIIRTGGEKRLSNFLLWQSAYSELFFTDTLWPEFSPKEFFAILAEYEGRQRRRGA